MKKIFVSLLAFMLVFSLFACGETEDTSSNVFSAADVSSKEQASSAPASSEAESSEEISKEPEIKAPDFIDNFLSIGNVDTKVNAKSSNAIRLTDIDGVLTEGSIVLYTPAYGKLNKDDLAEYAVAEFSYSSQYFGYVMSAFHEVGSVDADVMIPEDGFVVAAHSFQELYIDRMSKITAEQTIFPHGLHLYTGADYTISKAATAPVIDGKFSADEWGDYFVEDVNATNPSWSYAQFEVNNYYSTASYYTTYDDQYIYLCVVVDSPYHYCPITSENAGDMWKYECIQVKVSSETPDGDYILENFDHVSNNTAVVDGIVRSYGFAANDDGDTCYYESGYTTEFTGLAGCSRDDSAQLTVYEVAIPFAEYDITPEKDAKIGLTFSINSTNEEDVGSNVWKNITYRNGGGVIGRNDWSKIPVVTLG